MNKVIHALLAACLLAGASLGRAEVQETLEWKPYVVPHQAGQNLRQAINNAAPRWERGKVFHAYTRWYVNWNYRWREKDVCRMEKVNVKLRISIELPDLQSDDAGARQEFASYIVNLKEHEMGHAETGRKVAANIVQRIKDLPPMSTCKELDTVANQAAMEEVKRGNQMDIDYDKTTRHGATQGAVLP